jgi:DNA topoisomerase-2
MSKHIEQTYQVLDEISHIRKRTGMYAGSTTINKSEEWVYDIETKKMVKKTISVIPAFIKIFSEILDNAIDESRRAPDVLDTIRVEIRDDGSLMVQDNGRGIPVEIHPITKQYVAETIFSNLRAGSNFNDEEDQQIIGTNGVGSTLTNVLSSSFMIESCDGKKMFKQEFFNGMRERTTPKIKESDKNLTRITFTPDYEFFKMKGLDDDHRLRLYKKVVDAAATNTNVKFYLNGERIAIKSFEDYIGLFTDGEYVYDENESWKVGVSKADEFEQISFVNSVETYQGGTHINYVANQIVDALREILKKKHKVNVSPGDIRGHMRLYISANVNRPRFSSQTKENLVSTYGEYKTSWEVPQKFIQKLLKTSIIQSVLDWVAAKEHAAQLADMRKLNKETDKVNLKKIKKFHDATEKDRSKTVLILGEGDSACSSILGARDPKLHATFPLRGRPINVSASSFAKVKENEEFENIRNLIGLKYGEPADIVNMNFGQIIIASDADEFGNSIAGLIINMFYKLWPEIITSGKLSRLMTPIVLVEYKKQTLEFFTEAEFDVWKEKHQDERYVHKYLKGLGSSTPKQFKNYMSNLDKYLIQYTYAGKEDDDVLELCFAKDQGMSDRRKTWLDLE